MEIVDKWANENWNIAIALKLVPISTFYLINSIIDFLDLY